ncbi:MAG: hypothetical protein AAGH89_14490, partial [Verrucomicrobiota bacterium]
MNASNLQVFVLSFGLLPGLLLGEQSTEEIFSVFQNHCIQCHGENGKVKGKINLLEITDVQQLMQDPELLREIVDVIDFEEMPPEDEPQIEPEARTKLLATLENLLHQSVTEKKAFAHTPIRRMNRFQYNNAVVDLFDLNCIVFTLPERMMRVHRDYFQPETGQMADTVYVGSRPLGKSQRVSTVPRLPRMIPEPSEPICNSRRYALP